MRARILYAALLTSAGCKQGDQAQPLGEAAPIRNDEAAPVGQEEGARPAPPSDELGRAGDRLLEASPHATWVALCRGEDGVLLLDAGQEVPFHTLVDHDENGRWVVVSSETRVQLVDAWTRTTSPLPGRGHDLDRDGTRLSYWLEHDTESPSWSASSRPGTSGASATKRRAPAITARAATWTLRGASSTSMPPSIHGPPRTSTARASRTAVRGQGE